MDNKVTELKTQFTDISNIVDENEKIFDLLDGRVLKLKETYAEFISSNQENFYVFGLDSFHFQGKLIDIEYEDMRRMFLSIINRMYGEYYKLYKIIVQYIDEEIEDNKIKGMTKLNAYPVYLDLEPFKQYGFDIIQTLHDDLLTLVVMLNSKLDTKETELNGYKIKKNIGLSIDNFVNSFNYTNVILRERINLFVSYIDFFHKMHSKYILRFLTKLKLMYSQVSHDIKFEDNAKLKKGDQKNIVNNLKGDKIDKEILRSLKECLTEYGSEDSSDDEYTSNMSFSPQHSPVRAGEMKAQFDNDNTIIDLEIREKEEEEEITCDSDSILEDDVPLGFIGIDHDISYVPVVEESVVEEEPVVEVEVEPVVEEEEPVVEVEVEPVVEEEHQVVEEEHQVVEEEHQVVKEEQQVVEVEVEPVVEIEENKKDDESGSL